MNSLASAWKLVIVLALVCNSLPIGPKETQKTNQTREDPAHKEVGKNSAPRGQLLEDGVLSVLPKGPPKGRKGRKETTKKPKIIKLDCSHQPEDLEGERAEAWEKQCGATNETPNVSVMATSTESGLQNSPQQAETPEKKKCKAKMNTTDSSPGGFNCTEKPTIVWGQPVSSLKKVKEWEKACKSNMTLDDILEEEMDIDCPQSLETSTEPATIQPLVITQMTTAPDDNPQTTAETSDLPPSIEGGDKKKGHKNKKGEKNSKSSKTTTTKPKIGKNEDPDEPQGEDDEEPPVIKRPIDCAKQWFGYGEDGDDEKALEWETKCGKKDGETTSEASVFRGWGR